MYNIIQNRKIWLSISGILTGLSILAMIIWGFNFGIDFTGGSLLEVDFFVARPGIEEIQADLADLKLGSLIVQPVGESGMILRFQDISEDKHQEILYRLDSLVTDSGIESEVTNTASSSEDNIATSTNEEAAETEIIDRGALVNLEELRFDSVGPSIGQELKGKSINAILFVLVAIVLYISWAFRRVSKPVASWKYGLGGIIALIHDVVIVAGIFSVLGHFVGIEVGALFVTAMLIVLGYSINDTIVVYDRTRENLIYNPERTFEDTVNKSINQTMARSINTTLTTLLILAALYFFGGESIKDFVLALLCGIFLGAYSSIFVASSLLVVWQRVSKKR